MVRISARSKNRHIKKIKSILTIFLFAGILATTSSATEYVRAQTTNEYYGEVAWEVKAETLTNSKDNIVKLINKYADQYGVSRTLMYNIIECETAHTFDPNIQSGLKYKFSDSRRGIIIGQQEKSWGLAQIHLPDHPQVTIEQAKDPEFAIKFMAENLSEGRHLWYCERIVNEKQETNTAL
jgi:hypothetical protein